MTSLQDYVARQFPNHEIDLWDAGSAPDLELSDASRLAGQRANSQPQASGRTITVVAAFLDDDVSASTLARSVGPVADYEVRIVDHNGGWRSPGLGTS